MPRLYTASVTGVTPNTSNDLMTILPASGKPIRIKRIRASGEATTSTVMRTVVNKSSSGTTGGGALTLDKASSSDPAASTTVNTTWSVQPTLAGQNHYQEGWNAFGGGFDLTLDGREIYLLTGDQLSIRNTVGTGTMNLEVEIEEL